MSLYYTHDGTTNSDEFRLALDSIDDVVLLESQKPGVGQFEIITSARKYRFSCNTDEAKLWVRDIKNTQLCPPGSTNRPSLYQRVQPTSPTGGSTVGSLFRTLNRSLSLKSSNDSQPMAFTYPQASALQCLYDFISSSNEVSVSVIQAIFESLELLEKSERGKASRQMGQVLAMWLGETSNAKYNTRRASMASMSQGSGSSSLDMLGMWLEISLVREFRDSCNFSPNTCLPALKNGKLAGSAECEKTSHSVDTSAFNTPLRRDNVESLFLTSFIKGVAQNTGMLSTWLLPSLIRIASSPESFVPNTKPQTQSVNHEDESSNSEESSQVKSGSSPESVLDNECSHLFDTMQSNEHVIPPSMRLLISTIHRLTIAGRDGAQHNGEPEYGVFYATSCAALFLRLICPAVISPLEWGALRRQPEPQGQQSHIFKQKNTPFTHTGHPHGARPARATEPILPSTIQFDLRATLKAASGSKSGTHLSAPPSPVSAAGPMAMLSEKEVDCIEGMDKNPAVAAIIFGAHVLSHPHLLDVWTGSEDHGNTLKDLVKEVVKLVPMDKLEAYVERYESRSRSVVDPATKSAFESSEVRKALVSFARVIQRVANLSTLPEVDIERHAIETQVRLTIASGDQTRVAKEKDDMRIWTTDDLSSDELQAVRFQTKVALLVKHFYETMAEVSKKVTE
eukprot:CAMPEP_0185028698 /NCGR_PEP_ID=MMETSP1103-20130426/14616_1 /TAXON_ID=36769 /ORGANISM="Paraphysomonas bandaiensis, Strain Caron Lab Isolate" /LENGTH=679 /DNA_ID=CAMNT_0027563203 /DNA_START=218 /DNA_END=2257 /DNA_ORIENTATION=-